MKSKRPMNLTMVCIIALLTAGSVIAGSSITNSIQGYTDTSTNAATIAALQLDGLYMANTSAATRVITFNGSGARFSKTGSNFIITDENYGGNSFVAELDITSDALDDGSVFCMGMGSGIPGTFFDLPDLDSPVETFFLENGSSYYSTAWRQQAGLAKERLIPAADPNWYGLYSGNATVTYNAASSTISFAVVRDSDSINYGPFSTEGMFDEDSSRIFIGGKGFIAYNLTITVPDDDTPPPNPSFAVGPVAIADNKITMSSTTVVDDLAKVQYNFRNITLDTESGWQSDTNWLDTGLTPSNTYFYTVQARDLSTTTNYSGFTTNSAMTSAADTIAPLPSTMTFVVAPVAVNPNEVYMEATTASDNVTDVEYNFKNTTLNTESGWQAENFYADTGLTPGTPYSYTVTARDTSFNMNETLPSTPAAVAMTPDAQHFMVNPLTSYSGNSTQLVTFVALGADSLQVTDTESADQAIVFDGAGAAFGTVTSGVDGRNVLRTTETNYNASSFEAYVTINFETDQNAVIAMGPAVLAPLDIGFGVPDLNAQGVDGIMGEFTSTYAKLLRSIDGAATEILTNVVTAAGTHRLKLAYDAVAETATVSVDVGYTGVFVEDIDMGTYSTAGMWAGQPVRVSVAGGDGLVCTDLVIKADPADAIVDDLSIDVSGGLTVLSWDASAGSTYDVEYKTDLVALSWTGDSSASNIFATANGTLSTTSTVSGVEVFYRVMTK